jgi:2-polyprenyl-3-methyl-5-hydroxy-6-metoxy-1,4-benzoquinol methylase
MSEKAAKLGQTSGLLSPWLQRKRFSAAKKWVIKGRLLDYGCGDADFSQWLPKDVVYVGVENDQTIVAHARSRYPDLEIIHGNLETDKTLLDRFIVSPFHGVVMTAVIEHLSNPESVLDCLYSVLAPGGRIVVTTPMPIGRKLLDIGKVLGITSKEAHAEHKELISRKRLIGLLISSEFEIEHYSRFLFGLNQLIVGRKPHQGR